MALPIRGNLLRFVFLPPIGWEIVQLVGLQTLDLAILVRVQVSQPRFLHTVTVAFSSDTAVLKRFHMLDLLDGER